MTKKFYLHEEIKCIAILIVLCVVIILFVFGCVDGGSAPRKDPAFAAQVNAALDAIEAAGLGEWAAWGREHRGIVVNNEALVPADCLGYTWAFHDAGGGDTLYNIALGDKWRRLAVREQGLVLLHELWHVRTGDLGHPVELWQLLAAYNDYRETR